MTKKPITCKITQEAFNQLEKIANSIGKYPTGLACEILEIFKDVDSSQFYEVIVAIRKHGKKSTIVR